MISRPLTANCRTAGPTLQALEFAGRRIEGRGVAATMRNTTRLQLIVAHWRVQRKPRSGSWIFLRFPQRPELQRPKAHLCELTAMRGVYPQSLERSPTGVPGTLLRSAIRTRAGHENRTVVRLIDVSRKFQFSGGRSSALGYRRARRPCSHHHHDARIGEHVECRS